MNSHLSTQTNEQNKKRPMAYGDGNPCPDLEQAQPM